MALAAYQLKNSQGWIIVDEDTGQSYGIYKKTALTDKIQADRTRLDQITALETAQMQIPDNKTLREFWLQQHQLMDYGAEISALNEEIVKCQQYKDLILAAGG